MGRNKCDVNGCSSHVSKVPHHLFPRPHQRAYIWQQFCENPKLSDVPLEELCKKATICRKHFEPGQFRTAAGIKLNFNAVPSLLPPSSFLLSSSASTSACTITSPPCTSTPLRSTACIPPVSPIMPNEVQNEGLEEVRVMDFSDVNVTESLGASFVSNESDVSMSQSCSSFGKGARRSILSNIGLTRVEQMTPRKKILHEKIMKDSRKINRWRKIALRYKSDLKAMQRNGGLFRALEKELPSPSAVTILSSILREGKKKPKGRRWSKKEKVIALSIFKQSPKTYAVLRSLLPLPSKRTLTKVLSTFNFLPGVNRDIFSNIASFVGKMPEKNRLCTLMFDEMAIKPELVYSVHNDIILGFEDHGSGKRRNAIAKVAMVFMVRGVYAKWKQPLAYYFSAGGTSSYAIKTMIEDILENLQRVGLKVIATVCDMGSNNVKALKLMGATYLNPCFTYGEQNVVTIFDPPHLLKCFRNLLQNHDIAVPVVIGGQEVTLNASWRHLLQLYEDDGQNPFGRLFHLSEKHLNPTGFAKMKVVLAAQVFSRAVGLGISGLVAKGLLENDGLATAEVLISINNLFDSLNGDTGGKYDEMRKLKVPMTARSHHHKLLAEMGQKISRWQFLNVSTGKLVNPPSQKGWLATIKGLQLLWERFHPLSKHLSTRCFNQDPIENLFNAVRQNSGCNRHPNAVSFVSALKTAIINGLVNYSTKGNCQADDCVILTGLADIVNGVFSEGEVTEELCRQPQSLRKLLPAKLGSLACIAAHIAQDLLKCNPCVACSSCISAELPPAEIFFLLKEDENTSFLPSEELVLALGQFMTGLDTTMERISFQTNLSHLLVRELKGKANFSFLSCNDHREEMEQRIIQSVALLCIRRYCIQTTKEMNSH